MNLDPFTNNLGLHDQTVSSNIHGQLFPQLNKPSGQSPRTPLPNQTDLTEKLRNALKVNHNIADSANGNITFDFFVGHGKVESGPE